MMLISRLLALLFMTIIYCIVQRVRTMPLQYKFTKEIVNTDPTYARVIWKSINSKNELNSNSNEDGLDHYYDDELSGDFEIQNENENKERQYDDKNRKEFWEINLNVTKDRNIIQGDIRLSKLQRLKIENPLVRRKRAAQGKGPEYLWKKNTIYYKIDNVFSKSARKEIKRGIRHWKKQMKGCLEFVRLDRNKTLEAAIKREEFGGGPVPHILFTKTTSGCWSQVGRTDTYDVEDRTYVEGQQLISIGDRCGELGTVIHEIGHAVGFWHEQSRSDRDHFIKIVGKNILEGQKQQFKRMHRSDVNSMGYAYDFWSVMHYGPYFFTKSANKPTIKVQKRYKHLRPEIGQRRGLSYLDIAQVRAMYKCNVIPSVESRSTCVRRSTKGRDYRGKLDYTESGVFCQPWNKEYPNKHNYNLNNPRDGLGKHNYCRNPGGTKDRPWCFTTLEKKTRRSWEYCDLQYCNS